MENTPLKKPGVLAALRNALGIFGQRLFPKKDTSDKGPKPLAAVVLTSAELATEAASRRTMENFITAMGEFTVRGVEAEARKEEARRVAWQQFANSIKL